MTAARCVRDERFLYFEFQQSSTIYDTRTHFLERSFRFFFTFDESDDLD